MRQISLGALSEPLSQEILSLKQAGLFTEELALLQVRQAMGPLSDRLELEKAVIQATRDSFCLSEEEVLSQVARKDPGFSLAKLDLSRMKGDADFRIIEGQRRYLDKCPENIIASLRLEDRDDELERLLDENMAVMKAKGSREARITLCLKLAARNPQRRIAIAHLPLPRTGESQHYLEILDTDKKAFKISSESSSQRVIAIRDHDSNGYKVTYSYVVRSDYVNIDPTRLASSQPSSFTGEELPHIQFTPYLRSLAKEIVGKETNAALKARRIYDWVTTHVHPAHMAGYLAYECIPSFCASSRRGDSGAQALLLVTLCRICRIPAIWQSGFLVTPSKAVPHAWAMICLEPYGFRPIDLGLGSSAYRQGNIERWNYCFGNLDVFRMTANNAIGADFEAYPKKFFRADPVDSQIGEIEYSDRGLESKDLRSERQVEAFQLL